jgi:Contractile injection system tube protein/LysM domain
MAAFPTTFAKATITPLDPPGADIPVLYNPNQYSFEKGIQLAEMGVPGLGAPIIQYVRGNARTLSMELFFDTYELGEDVRTYTNELYALMNVESETHVPAICRFTWGPGKWGKRDEASFRCVIERVSGRFTLFLADGTPVRATLTVTFREFVDVEMLVRSQPTQSADHTKTRLVSRGDTLSSIAGEEYGDPGLWRPIAAANLIDNPRVLEPGRALVIPALDERGELR